jgi:FkbM family methyltransferase
MSQGQDSLLSAVAALRRRITRLCPGCAAMYDRVRDWYYYRSMRCHQTRWGFALYGDPDLAAIREESGEIGHFNALLERCDMFVDVGANVGFFTCLAASRGYPCLSIEPHPENVKVLYRNILRNGFAGIEVFPMAVGAGPGIMVLRGGGQGASLVEGWGKVEQTYEQFVSVTSLDALLADRFARRQIFIKLDVEGHEYAVVRGASRLLASEPAPLWIFEHGYRRMFPETNPNFIALFELFWAHGYTVRNVESGGQVLTRECLYRWISEGDPDRHGEYYVAKREGDLASGGQ